MCSLSSLIKQYGLLFGTLLGIALTSGCAPSPHKNERPLDLPFVKIYPADFDTVWMATVAVLEDIYSIALGRRDTGQLDTDWMQSRFNTELYELPTQNSFLEDVKYRIRIKLAKGFVTDNNKPATRVQIVKELTSYKNILVDWQRIPTDQLEESVLLYRIGQRIDIIETLKERDRRKRRSESSIQ